MINQTVIFSREDINPDGIAYVSAIANHFMMSEATGFINFHVMPVEVSPTQTPDIFQFTVQVNYYDPSIQ